MAQDDLTGSGAPQSRIDILIGLYDAAAEDLSKIVLHPPGKSEEAQTFAQARAAAQLMQIERIVNALRQHSASWIGQIMPDVFNKAIKLAESQAQDAGIAPKQLTTDNGLLTGSFNLVDPRTVDVFARDMYADLSKAAGSMGQMASHVLRQTRQLKLSEPEIDAILAGGVITGKPVETIRQLRDALRVVHGEEVTIISKNGNPIHFKVRDYAALVARTKTRQASVVARHERLEELGLDLVSIVGRISKNFCTAYLGQVFSISGRSDKYPPLASLPSHGPPFHPNCSKSTRPFVEALASKTQLKNADGGEEEEKMRNLTPAQAQRRFKDLQMYAQVRDRHATTAAKMY